MVKPLFTGTAEVFRNGHANIQNFPADIPPGTYIVEIKAVDTNDRGRCTCMVTKITPGIHHSIACPLYTEGAEG